MNNRSDRSSLVNCIRSGRSRWYNTNDWYTTTNSTQTQNVQPHQYYPTPTYQVMTTLGNDPFGVYTGNTATTTMSDTITVTVDSTVDPQYVQSILKQIDIQIQRTDAPRHRKKAPLEFNPYINASDMLEQFIKYAGENGARQADVMGLPIELFVKWLVIEACAKDDEEPNVKLEPKQLRVPQPRCLGCQRYMKKNIEVPLHGNQCASRYFQRCSRTVPALAVAP